MEEVRMVFLAANPSGKPALKLAEELSAIRASVEQTSAQDKISIYPYFAARPDNLRGALEIHRPHILHFCGYENDDGGILLEDANRQPAPFSPIPLVALFKEYSHNVKLVFLNTCRVEKSAIGLSKHVDAVVAFPGFNLDDCAVPFAGKLYGELAKGSSLQQAFDQAKSVYFENNIDPSDHPKVWTKRGAEAASLTIFSRQRRAATTKPLSTQLHQSEERKASEINVQQASVVASRQQSEVFISYSHKDKKWLDEFHVFLQPVLRNGIFSVWDDTKIKPGSRWQEDIEKALSAAKVALLLVSAPFLASRFIQDKELPPLLEAAKTRGLQILWVCLSACPYKETAIEPYQATHDPNRPLDSLPRPKRNAVLTKICEHIKAAFAG